MSREIQCAFTLSNCAKAWQVRPKVLTTLLTNGFPYVGKNKSRPTNGRGSEHVATRLKNPNLKIGPNVTKDTYFTFVKLAKQLTEKVTSKAC